MDSSKVALLQISVALLTVMSSGGRGFYGTSNGLPVMRIRGRACG
jgi:hypothetical protein